MSDIRRQARARRVQIGLELETPTPAENVLQACQAQTGFTRYFVPPHDICLAGALAVLDLEVEAIYQDNTQPLPKQRFDAAHEFAHLWLHSSGCHCAPEDLDPAQSAEPTTGAISKVDGYSPVQRRENEANLFAAELLLPTQLARRMFLKEGATSETIAQLLGLPTSLVQMQMADAVLMPPPPIDDENPPAPTPASAPVNLDPSQYAAAQVAAGPLLLGAGPGTGKTKTLVERCRFLTQSQNVSAERILALTFSRKAAGEMRERLAAAGVGAEGAGPWVGTFHSFGLEILRRFGERIGLPHEIKLLDRLDAVTLLENHLAALNLTVLDNLYNPAMHLGGILGQIGRAKDELCPPERYAKLCQAMQTQADEAAQALASRVGKVLVKDRQEVDKIVERAARAQEVAHCYGVYERLMRQGGYLDFGDLISRTVALLEGHPDVLAILQDEYPHILADEYQDVNRACAYLVKLLAGEDAHGLWAVGDHRQSIYQFQGASPANVASFSHDYPTGQRLELGVNYRSRRPIVDLFGAAATEMEGTTTSWEAHRGVEEQTAFPAVTSAAAPDDDGQAAGIAQAIQTLKASGKEYRSQAILCRSHAQAEVLAERLSERDIPTLYLGALLERPEIKDLLCLLALFADPDGSALLRVAAFPEYAVPQANTLAVLTQIRREEMPILQALAKADLPPGLQTLGKHLAELETMENDPAGLLRHYLFGLSQYLRPPAEAAAKPFVQLTQGMAIHQLLGLAASFDRRLIAPNIVAGPPNKIREFLAHLRRLSSSSETLRGSLPDEAEALDAVRLMTAHAAKGLEYPVVFLPNLNAGQFPTKGRSDGIPEPPGLADTAGQEMDEERCLFFVALSRARDHLILSRAAARGPERPLAPSPLLLSILPHLEAQGIAPTEWPSGQETQERNDELSLTLPEALPEYTLSALEAYERCPRQYHYGRVLKLPGAFLGGGYPQFHACVRSALNWWEDAREQNLSPSSEDLAAYLETIWAEKGPVGHLHEAKYKASAHQMLQTAASFGAETERRMDVKNLRATLTNCHVHVRPDALRRDSADGTLIAARHLTGKPGSNDHTDKRLSMYRRAAQQTHPETPIRVELRYLADGENKIIEPPETKQQLKWDADRLAKYEKAAQGIGAGLFPAKPESGDECARCAYALICPL